MYKHYFVQQHVVILDRLYKCQKVCAKPQIRNMIEQQLLGGGLAQLGTSLELGCINEVNRPRARLVLGWVTVCKGGSKPFRYPAMHPGQLSLAIPPWIGAMSTSKSWDVNRHTARCTSLVSAVWQCKLVSGWGEKKRRSAPPCGPWHGKDFTFQNLIQYLWFITSSLHSLACMIVIAVLVCVCLSHWLKSIYLLTYNETE